MIILHGFGPAFDQPELSPFVMKAMALLAMAGVGFRMKTGASAVVGAPRGKLPYIIDNGETITDSSRIRRHLETRYGADFSGGYDADTLSAGFMAERMLENSTYFAVLERRWLRPDGWKVLSAAAFHTVPLPFRRLVAAMARRSVKTALHGQGMGRRPTEEIDGIVAADADALARMLGARPYLLGDRPCGYDATALSFLVAGTCNAFPGPQRDAILAHANLIAYRDRLRGLYLAE